MKTCSKCCEAKPVTEFYKAASNRDGLNSCCKVCVRQVIAFRKASNPDKTKESQAKYRAKNKQKHKEYAAKWYAANAEKVKEAAARWHATNPEKAKAAASKYRESNKDKVLARHFKYRAENREKVNASAAKWRSDNPDKEREKSAKWRAANPEICRLKSHNYRARKLDAGGILSKDLAERLFKLQRGKCACGCKQPLGDDYHRDHIMPLALGGTNTDDNIQLLRSTCNLQKSAKHPIDFMQQRGFLL